MSDERFDGLEEDDIDTGQPIAQLASLREEPQIGFFGRIRRSIERRQLGSDMAELSVSGLAAVFLAAAACDVRAGRGSLGEASRDQPRVGARTG